MPAARKKKIPQPDTVPVDTIWWHDASSIERERIADNIEPKMIVNTGFVTLENAVEITLSHSIECHEEWDTPNHDGYKIPRYAIVKRVRHGVVPVIAPEVEAYKERVNEPAPEEKKE